MQQTSSAAETRSSFSLRRIAIVLVVIAVSTLAPLFIVPTAARSWLSQQLGPHGRIAAVELLTAQIAVRGLEIVKPDESWPVASQLRVEHAAADLSLRALASAPRSIPKLTIDGLYIAIVRKRDGSTVVLPELTQRKRRARPERTRPREPFTIQDVALRDATVELIDDSMQRRTRVKIHHVQGHIRDVVFPELETRSAIELTGKLPGPSTTGTVSVSGWMKLTNQDANLKLRARGLDLHVFEPYLLKSMSSGVEKGSFDLQLSPTLRDRNVNAPGHIDIHDLKLTPGKTPGDSFLNMPRAAVIESLEGLDDTIAADFTLKGNLNDPQFSIEQGLLTQIGIGVAAALGVSVLGLVEGVGNLGVEGTKAVGHAISGD